MRFSVLDATNTCGTSASHIRSNGVIPVCTTCILLLRLRRCAAHMVTVNMKWPSGMHGNIGRSPNQVLHSCNSPFCSVCENTTFPPYESSIPSMPKGPGMIVFLMRVAKQSRALKRVSWGRKEVLHWAQASSHSEHGRRISLLVCQ